ncbi:MAG: aldehyde dehydrogenase family protein [Armatimonadetes bacterium]|nr:aldehyde dehydrogenase family protein [Armatimonadota bacterium]
MTEPLRLAPYVAGEFVPSDAEGFIPSVNPSRPEETLALVPGGSKAVVDTAVEAAATAQPAWRKLTGPQRADFLMKWADAIQARHEELSMAIMKEVGKPISEAKGEVGRCVAILRYNAGEAVRSIGEVIPALAPGALQFSVREPVGVVGLITPWNFPLAIPLWKAAPALAMGNAVLLKPAEASGLCAHLLAETARDLPAGVFNVVQGAGTSAGTALCEHPGIAAVSFTGSVGVGTRVAVACAARNAKFQTEMGGKNAAVVLKDADLERAANLVAGGAIRFAGQKCTATSRVIVEKVVWNDFQTALVKATEALKIGPVEQADTASGPVVSEASQARLGSTLSSAAENVVYRSTASGEGFYVPPTILGPVDPESDLAQEELFGPVLAMLEADDLDHALQLANQTRFGLSTAIYTRDIASALRYAHEVEAGLVRINGDTTGVDPHAPFGGMKASSSGSREQGSVAKDFFTDWKTAQINP